MNDSDHRRYSRLKHRAQIKVFQTAPDRQFITTMRDFSEGGLFLLCSAELIPDIDTVVEVQTTEFEDAPIRATKVVRVEPGTGFGVEFI